MRIGWIIPGVEMRAYVESDSVELECCSCSLPSVVYSRLEDRV